MSICINKIFFFNDTATTEIYTLSLHDALPIWLMVTRGRPGGGMADDAVTVRGSFRWRSCRVVSTRSEDARWSQASQIRADRKSTRLNSSHANISYAVFCLKKKKTT